jgi:hypothetical protein
MQIKYCRKKRRVNELKICVCLCPTHCTVSDRPAAGSPRTPRPTLAGGSGRTPGLVPRRSPLLATDAAAKIPNRGIFRDFSPGILHQTCKNNRAPFTGVVQLLAPQISPIGGSFRQCERSTGTPLTYMYTCTASHT